jgi:hypothetical protein
VADFHTVGRGNFIGVNTLKLVNISTADKFFGKGIVLFRNRLMQKLLAVIIGYLPAQKS